MCKNLVCVLFSLLLFYVKQNCSCSWWVFAYLMFFFVIFKEGDFGFLYENWGGVSEDFSYLWFELLLFMVDEIGMLLMVFRWFDVLFCDFEGGWFWFLYENWGGISEDLGAFSLSFCILYINEFGVVPWGFCLLGACCFWFLGSVFWSFRIRIEKYRWRFRVFLV